MAAPPRVLPAMAVGQDALLRRLAAARDGLVVPLARAAGEFVARSGWFDCGFARAGDFARERLGRSGRWLYDLATLDDRFRCFPSLARAVSGADGAPVLGRVAALLVGQLARDADIDHWIALARMSSVRQLRDLVHAKHGQVPPDCEPRTVPVSLAMPGAVRIAFEEVLSLHRANVGREVGVADFLEALVGETATAVLHEETEPAACAPSPEHHRPVWHEQSAIPSPGPAGRAALRCLARLEVAVESTSHPASLADLVRALTDLARIEEEIEVHLGELLAELGDLAGWTALGYSSAADYGEERLRLSPNVARRRESLSRTLRRLPLVQAAYRSGDIHFEAAQILGRILRRNAPPEDENSWLEHARSFTIKRLRDEEALALRNRLLEAEPPRPADDRTWLGALERHAGRSLDTVLGLGLGVLDRFLHGRCDDDVFLRLRLLPENATAFQRSLARVRVALLQKPLPASPAEAARALPSQRLAWHLVERRQNVPLWLGLLAMLEEYALTWDDTRGMPDRGAEATYGLGGYRCMAPGCTSRNHLERHHIGYRSQCKSDEPHNLLCLCRMHHQEGEHQGRAALAGRAPLDIRWRLGKRHLATYFHNERWVKRRDSAR